jgi:transposase-like protein
MQRYNVASSAVYKWRDEFIRAGTAAMDPWKSTNDQKLMREKQELKAIIGDLTIANETLKKFNLQGVVGGGGRNDYRRHE